jgi:aryl-alcohol dehydrogenase-like predicted oxidoreductase
MQVTKIGLGLAAIGRPDYINIRDQKDIDKSYTVFRQQAMDLLDFAYQHGIGHFDTAPSYGSGEHFLIDWLQKHNYKNLEVSTMWGYTYVANWEIGYAGEHEIKEHSLGKLEEQWLQSQALLPALKTYQIHSATFDSKVLDNLPVLRIILGG